MKNERENRREDGFNKRPRRTPSQISNMSEDEIVRGWKKDTPSYKNEDSNKEDRPPRRDNSRGDYSDRKPRNDRRDGGRSDRGGYSRGGDDRRNSRDNRGSGERNRSWDKPRGDRPQRDDYDNRRPSWEKNDNDRGERRNYSDRKSNDNRSANSRYGDNKRDNFNRRDSDDRRPSWEKPQGDRNRSDNRGSGERRGYGDRDRNSDDRRPSNNRYGNDRRRDDRRQGGDYDNRRPSREKSDNDRGERRSYSDRNSTDRRSNSRYGDNERSEFRPKRGATKYDPDRQKGYRDKKKFDKKKFDKKRKNAPSQYGEPRKDNEPLRLNRYIANAGICSRREADTLIAEGHITVNGDKITEMGYKVMPKDKVMYKDKLLKLEKFVYMVMNKPKNTITTLKDPEGRQTVIDLLREETDERIYPVGRLDRNTTGVLLFTNDGEFAQAMTHPSSEIEKVYKATLDRVMSTNDVEKMVEGFELEDGFTQVDSIAFVEKDDKKTLGVVIHSGRNRIIHRMFNHLGYTVEKLDRTSFAGIDKHDVKRGKFRFLREKEINALKRKARTAKK